jgi:acyl-CoA synthetase (AMP-forming)/AMP-acid ligase II
MCDGWLCTKDIAVITPEGLLKIKGRSDDLIIRAGMNIYPAEIEAALKKDGRVREVLALKVETTHMGTQIGLKIAGDFQNVDEVKKLCASLLPKFQMPIVIEIYDELPKNGSGKIIRH